MARTNFDEHFDEMMKDPAFRLHYWALGIRIKTEVLLMPLFAKKRSMWDSTNKEPEND